MNTPAPKQQNDGTPFVEPSLRPSQDHPSRRRIISGVVLLLIGFVAILFGGSDSLGQAFLIGGSIFVLASLFLFGSSFRLRFQQARDQHDPRKLYGTNKA